MVPLEGVLVALGEVIMYLRERCWRQVGGGAEDFILPLSPPRVIEREGVTNLGDESIKASGFLDWARDYHEWWASDL